MVASSDSASSSIPHKTHVKTQNIMVVRPYTSIKANMLLIISEIPRYLVNKLKKRSALTVVN